MMSEQSSDPELRAALTSAAKKINPTPPSFSTIQAAGRRRRHQRMALATAVSAVAIAGVAATALAVVPQRSQVGEPAAPPTSTTTPLPSSIPTSAPPSHPTSTASAPVPSTPTATASASPAPPCTTAQLKVSGPGSWAGAGSFGQVFTITNVSPQPCGLPGWITNLHGTTSTGRHQVVKIDRTDREFDFTGNAATLPPGEHAGFGFTEANPDDLCATLHPNVVTIPWITFSIGPKATFTKNLMLPADEPDPIELGCGARSVGVSEIGALVVPNSQKPKKYDVEATETVPKRVHGGQKINYTVTLTNKSKIALPLVPCPTYGAELKGLATKDVTGQLDCGGQTSLAVGGSISFHLSITVPVPPQTERVPMIWWDSRFNSLAASSITVTK